MINKEHEPSEFTQKIDVLDIIIDVLGKHEARLDKAIEEIETIAKVLMSDPRFHNK